MNQDLDIGMLLRYVLTSHELWGSSCVGICASRGVLTLMTANWPLMVVNAFWLALLAMVVNALWV